MKSHLTLTQSRLITQVQVVAFEVPSCDIIRLEKK